MRTVALVSTKGGSGKSTVAQCLSVAAVQEGKSAYLLDLDPQQSMAAWWRKRLGPDNPLLVTGADSASQAIEKIRKRRAERDYLFIDLPGAFMGLLNDAIHAADVLIVVTQASLKDIEAQGAAEGLIKDAGKRDRTVYVLNRIDSRTEALTLAALETLQKRGAPQPIQIRHMVEFIRADAIGKVANETNDKARAEIGALWQAVKEKAGDE